MAPQTRGRLNKEKEAALVPKSKGVGKGKARKQTPKTRKQQTTEEMTTENLSNFSMQVEETTTDNPSMEGEGHNPSTEGAGKGKARKQTPKTRAKGKRQTTQETTTENPRNFFMQTTTESPSEEEEEEEEGEDQWGDDDPPHRPDRAEVLEIVRKLKIELKTFFAIEFKKLVSYLKRKGISADEPYKQALRAVIEGRLADTKKREQISNRISEFIELRLLKTRRVFFQLLGELEWDDEFLNLIIVTIEDLKDLLVRFPELEELSSLAKDVLNANETWKASMAETLKDCVRKWLLESTKCEWMENWVKSPSETIESTRNAQVSLLKAWKSFH